MGKVDKIIKRILDGNSISYADAELLLKQLKFNLKISGSHHVFRKEKYPMNVTLKPRNQLLPYQMRILKEVLKEHGY